MCFLFIGIPMESPIFGMMILGQTGLWCEVTMHLARRDAMVGPLVDLYG